MGKVLEFKRRETHRQAPVPTAPDLEETPLFRALRDYDMMMRFYRSGPSHNTGLASATTHYAMRVNRT